MPDPLTPLLDLAGVRESLEEARAAVDTVLGHHVLRRSSAPVSAEASLRGARASAALDGSAYDLELLRSGAVTDPVVHGALRVATAIGAAAETWGRAPRQVLARFHTLAAHGLVPDAALGRPRPESAVRLDALSALVAAPVGAGGTAAPALLVAAIVHAELLTLRPFGVADGVVARAAARVTMVARGLDVKSVTVPEVGHLQRQPDYVGAAGAYATGTPDGVRAWLRHYCAAVTLGAAEGQTICDALAD